MSYLVSDLKDSVAGMLTSLDLNNVTNLDLCIQRAARQLAQRVDILDTMGRQNLILYDGVFDYSPDSSIFGASILDVKPQGNTRNSTDYAYKNPLADFDRSKGYGTTGTRITFEYNQGTPIMRVVSVLPTSRAIVDTMDDTSGWTAAGTAGSLTQDPTTFYEGSDSLRFTLTGAGTGTLTKTVSTQDLSTLQNVGVGFLAIYVPTSIANLSSITVKLGSSASAYASVTNTQGFLGAWTANNWLLVPFDFSTATNNGTPDWTKIDYLQVSIVTSGTITNFRVGSFWVSAPTPVTVIFESAAMFKASGANPSTTITNNNDQIILQDNAFTLFEHETACEILRQMGGEAAGGQLADLEHKMFDPANGLYTLYRADNPSQELRMIGSWYD